MNASVILNTKNQIAFIYGQPLGITPAWANFDVEMMQLNIFDEDSNESFLRLDKIDQAIYDRILKEEKILLAHVENDDFTKPRSAIWVPLTVATQYTND